MADRIEVSAKALAEKLENAGLTDDEKTALAGVLQAALAGEVEGFGLVGNTVHGAGAATMGTAGIAAGAAGGTALFGLASLGAVVNDLKGTQLNAAAGNSTVGIHIV